MICVFVVICSMFGFVDGSFILRFRVDAIIIQNMTVCCGKPCRVVMLWTVRVFAKKATAYTFL